MASGSKLAIYGAIGGNFAIAVTKFIAAGITGSSAMATEGIHSVVDTCNGGLLLLGIHRSQKAPDKKHPFGYGLELYFWTLIVAILIFGVGGGVSVYEGINHLRHPSELHDPTVNYIVLALAVVFEGIAWVLALKGFLDVKGAKTFWKSIRDSKDPTTYAVLFEDSAALMGLIVAFFGIFLGHTFNQPWMDGAASVVIGLILAGVAMILIYETRGLLVGESADPETQASIRDIVEAFDEVVRIDAPLTVHFGPARVLLALDIQFKEDLSAEQIEQTVDALEKKIRERHPEVRHIFLEAESITGDGKSPGDELK